jgi:transcriptional regulator with XRE-family HTH domain
LFVDEMRAMREQRGWSQSELADRAGYSESAVAMVETYQRPPTKTFARAMDKAFGTPGTFDRLERRLSNVPFPAAFRSFAPHEAEATALRMFEHSLVPGLLQTPDYAAAVLATKPNASADVIEADVSNRLARQALLGRQEPPMLWVLLDEGVLYRPVAPPPVMHDQLVHLVELSRLPNITIQLVGYDAGGHSGLLGAFVIADRSAGGSIVFIEDVTGGRVSEDAATVAEVGLRFDALRSESLPRNGSRLMIERVAKERWKDQAP